MDPAVLGGSLNVQPDYWDSQAQTYRHADSQIRKRPKLMGGNRISLRGRHASCILDIIEKFDL